MVGLLEGYSGGDGVGRSGGCSHPMVNSPIPPAGKEKGIVTQLEVAKVPCYTGKSNGVVKNGSGFEPGCRKKS
jgi:hypothetical protein